MSEQIKTPFPVLGKSSVVTRKQQPPLTSVAIENMRGIRPRDGTIVGAQRPGTTKWNTGVINSGAAVGSEKGQLLAKVVYDNRLLTYSELADADITEEFAIETPGINDCQAAAIDARGMLYVVDGNSQWAQINPAGEVVYKRSIPTVSGNVRAIAVDSNYDVYVGVSIGGTQADARMWRFRAEPDGTYTLAWELEVQTAAGNTGYVTDIKIVDGALYCICAEAAVAADCEVTVYNTPRTSVAPSAPDVQFATELYAGSIAVNAAGDIFTTAQEAVASPNADQWLTKYDSQGTEIWQIESLAGSTHVAGAAPANYHPGGIGLGVVVNSEGDLYTIGNQASGIDQDARFCKIVDDGDAPNMDPAGSYWEQTNASSLNFSFPFPRIAIDSFDNVYFSADFDDADDGHWVFGYEKDGAGGVAVPTIVYPEGTVATGERGRGISVAVAPFNETPEYQSGGPTRAEFIYCFLQSSLAATVDDLNVRKLRLVSAANVAAGTSARSVQVISAADGDIMKIASGSGGGVTPGGSGTLTPPQLETDPQLVQAVTAFQKIFISDGVNDVYYDPIDDVVKKWNATGAGKLPPRCKLLGLWRGRAMKARDPDNPHAWHASELGNFFGWEMLPKVISQTQAMTSSLQDGPGEVPDIINSIMPYNRDFCVFGCDSHMYMMRGDPAAGGQIEEISDITGTSLGSPWTKDPEGALYFFGSKGGLYRWVPGGIPERLSAMSIDRELFDIDLTNHYIAMQWSHREDGLRIMQLPFGDGGTEVSQYFWERKTGGWHVDTLDDTDHNPTAVMTLDGDDPDDRIVMFACEDGYIRYVDETAHSDDGEKIDANVLYGPYYSPEGIAIYVDRFAIELDREGSGCMFEWYATESVDDPLGAPQWSGELGPGHNGFRQDGNCRGIYLWLKLVNASDEQTFAITDVDVRMGNAGPIEVSSS